MNSASGSASAVLRRSVTVTNLFLRKQLWIWPLLVAAILAAVGFALRSRVDEAMKSSMANQLEALLAADVAALEQWLETQRSNAQTAASSQSRSELARRLLSLAERPESSPLVLAQSPELAAFNESIQPWLKAHDYVDFIVTNRGRRIVGAGQFELIGRAQLPRYEDFLNSALAGETVVGRSGSTLSSMEMWPAKRCDARSISLAISAGDN